MPQLNGSRRTRAPAAAAAAAVPSTEPSSTTTASSGRGSVSSSRRRCPTLPSSLNAGTTTSVRTAGSPGRSSRAILRAVNKNGGASHAGGPCVKARRSMRGLVLALGFAVLVGLFWFGGIVGRMSPHPTTGLSRDLYAQFYPRYEYETRALVSGRIPLWNPHELCGTPFLAGAQSGVLDPLIALAWGLAPAGAGLHVHFLLHLLLTGIATYLFCRAAGVGWQGATLATIAWTLSPALTRSLYQPNRIACLAWLPAIFWAGDRMRRLGTPASAAVLALTLGAQAVAGYPEFAVD